MSYDVQLYRKETMLKEQQSDNEDFFDKENNLEPFTDTQRQYLKDRLLQYEYEISREDQHGTHFRHTEEEGISVLLGSRGLYFQSTGAGIFEIGMTASEFTDTGEYAKYDPQAGGWEEE